MATHETLLILDFGSQFTQLIARRVREKRVYCEIHPFSMNAEDVRRLAPIGIVLSGGPESVFGENAPRVDPEIYDLGIPILGICYGMQLISHDLGGQVERAKEAEYGRAEVDVKASGRLFQGLDPRQTVWMSHGDRIAEPPGGFEVIASTSNAPVVAFENLERQIYGVQFHPEVSHTVQGTEMLTHFIDGVCGARMDWQMTSFIDESVAAIREKVGNRRVICAISGGVDSSVMATLVSKAIGDQLTCIFVDNGLLRQGEGAQVHENLQEGLGLEVTMVDAADEFLGALAGVTDPETKRKIIGGLFIDVFDREAKKFDDADFLAQGTLYPDVIESVSVKGPSVVIKTHHNVGGLPEKLGFELLEPLRFLFKDEVRSLGCELGLPESLIRRHPFPGPGLAVRILGEITAERVATLQEADAIFIQELRDAGLYDDVSQALAVLLPVKTVGVMGDERTYADVLALRSVNTFDFMTADWSPLPYDLLGRVANRIVNEVRGVNRVVYDITSKPPGTIEWE